MTSASKAWTAEKAPLLRAMMLVRPALSTQNFVPSLTHVAFVEHGYAAAYNDTMAIFVDGDFGPLHGVCLPGKLAIDALTSLSSDTVALSDTGSGHVVLSAGRSKFKVPYLPLSSWPFEFPGGELDDGHVVGDITDSLVRGIERCLAGVGKDATHPAQMGVTLDVEAGVPVLFSTDNFTISRSAHPECRGKITLLADSPVLLPTAFCEQVVALGKHFKCSGQLIVMPGSAAVEFPGKAVVFTKTLVDVEPLDFPLVIKRHVDVAKSSSVLREIPATLGECLDRVLMVVSSEVDKIASLSTDGRSLHIKASSATGDLEDSALYTGAAGAAALVDPALVVRGMKGCSGMALLPRSLLLASEDRQYMHLVSYCSK